MAVEVIYILYSYVFDLYFVSLTATTTKNNHGFHQKNNFCLSYYVKIHIYIICTLWTRIQGYHLTQSLMRSWNIYFFLLYIRIVNLLSRREGPRIYQNTLHPAFPWLIIFKNRLEHYLLFQISNLESIFAAIQQ